MFVSVAHLAILAVQCIVPCIVVGMILVVRPSILCPTCWHTRAMIAVGAQHNQCVMLAHHTSVPSNQVCSCCTQSYCTRYQHIYGFVGTPHGVAGGTPPERFSGQAPYPIVGATMAPSKAAAKTAAKGKAKTKAKPKTTTGANKAAMTTPPDATMAVAAAPLALSAQPALQPAPRTLPALDHALTVKQELDTLAGFDALSGASAETLVLGSIPGADTGSQLLCPTDMQPLITALPQEAAPTFHTRRIASDHWNICVFGVLDLLPTHGSCT